jgi:hypothetical protein
MPILLMKTGLLKKDHTFGALYHLSKVMPVQGCALSTDLSTVIVLTKALYFDILWPIVEA